MALYSVDIDIVEIIEPSMPGDALEEDVQTEYDNLEEAPRGYHLFVKIYLGSKEVELVLDTGASRSVFDLDLITEYAKEFEDQPNTQSAGVNSNIEMGIGHINELTIGGFTISNYTVGFTSLAHVNNLYSNIIEKQIVGLLGSDFMVKYNAEISYPKRKMFFSTPD